MDDRRTGKERVLEWDSGAARRAIGFFADILRLNGGEYEGRPFALLPWQQFVVGSLFGWRLGAQGGRRFRRAYIEAGKGCGKSPLAAGIGLLMLCADGEQRAEVYAAAYNRDQAKVLFRDAAAMVDQSPALRRRLRMSGGLEKTSIAYPAAHSFFSPISSERRGRGKSGPRPHCVLLDEIHEHPTAAMVEFLSAGVKHRKQPLVVMITNSGHDRETICWEYHDYAVGVVEGLREDDSFFSYVCALDAGDDPFVDEQCWIKANPSLPALPGQDYLRDQVRAAQGLPAKKYLARRLNFCEWTEGESERWVQQDIWRGAQADLSLDAYAGRSCFGGLDLSISSDLTALVLVFERGERRWDAFSFFWMAGDRLLELEENDGMAPRYRQWRDAGHLFAPAGKTIDYQHAAHLLAALCARFDVRAIAYDRAKLELLTTELDRIGADIPLVEHGQGFYKAQSSGLWMPGSIEETEAALLEGRLRIAENPMLTWCAASAVCLPSSIEPADRRFDKRKSTARIDGAVALVQAVGAACHARPQSSVYNQRGLAVI